MKILLAALAATALVGVAAPASAEMYGNVGYSRSENGDAGFNGVTVRVGTTKGYFGVEGEATIGYGDDTVPAGVVTAVVEQKSDVALYGTFVLPLNEMWSAHARVGYGNTSVDSSVAGSNVDDGSSFNYGVGSQLNWGVHGVRGDWTRKDFRGAGNGKSNVLSVAYVRRF